jgi:hypothetical protein
LGALGLEKGTAGYSFIDPTASRDPRFAEHVHRTFLEKLQSSQLDDYKFDRWQLNWFEPVSVNCIAWLGEEFDAFGGEVGVAEEQWLTRDRPTAIGKRNCICGSAVVCHYAFHTQRDCLDSTDILSRYEALCANRSS